MVASQRSICFFFYTQIHTVEEILHQLLDGLFHVYIVAIQCRILSMRTIISHTIPFTHHSFVIDYHTQVPSISDVDLIGAFNPSKKWAIRDQHLYQVWEVPCSSNYRKNPPSLKPSCFDVWGASHSVFPISMDWNDQVIYGILPFGLRG